MNKETLDKMTVNLLDALDRDEILNQKGTSAIVKLIKGDTARATIRHAIKSTGSDKAQFVEGLKALLSQYNSSAAFSVRSLCELAATDKTSRRFLEERITPLLAELGVICKTGEKSYHWQAWDKIGATPGLLDALKSSFEVTPAKAALRAAQDAAHDEALKLRVTKKQAAIANKRKATALQAVNASQEAERIAASLPTNEGGAAGWAKQNPTLIIVALLAGIVAIGGQMSGESTQGNLNVQMATMPTTAQIMTGEKP